MIKSLVSTWRAAAGRAALALLLLSASSWGWAQSMVFTINGAGGSSGFPQLFVTASPNPQLFDAAKNDLVNGSPASAALQSGQAQLVLGGWSGNPQPQLNSGGTQFLITRSNADIGSGQYVLYKLCETAVPTNCSGFGIAYYDIQGLRVSDDSFTITTAGGTINAAGNDIAFYQGAVYGASANYPAVTPVIVSQPAGLGVSLSIDATGKIFMPAGGNPGAYSFTYKLIDGGTGVSLSPSDVATVNLTVTIAPPVALSDIAVLPIAGGVVSHLANDTINGQPATAANVITNIISPPPGGPAVSVNAQGQMVVGAGAAGSYAIGYEICDISNQTSCSSTAYVNLYIHGVPVANPDVVTFQAPQPNGATTSQFLLQNDPIGNGLAGLVASVVSTGGIPGFTVSADGAISFSSLAAGTYAPTYRVCDPDLPTNCSAPAAINITVLNALVANSDFGAITPTAGTTINILANDTVSGAAATTANVTASVVSISPGLVGATINSAGQMVVSASPAGFTYSVQYKICDRTSLTNCANGLVSITSAIGPVAVADNVVIVPGGGQVNVLANDSIGGALATTANVSPTLVTTGGISGLAFNAAGYLVVPAWPPGGTYAPTYKICSVATPTTCSAPVAVNLSISAGPVAVADAISLAANTAGTLSILANDTVDGFPALMVDRTYTVQLMSTGGITGLSIDASNQLVIPALAAGNYAPTYRFCLVYSVGGPSYCSAPATVNIAVAAPVVTPSVTVALVANPDAITLPVFGGTFNVLTNDLYNGKAVTAGSVTLTLSSNAGIASSLLNAAGGLYIPANLLPGAYQLEYKMCAVVQPATCASAKVNIVISTAVTTATRKAPSVPGATQAVSTIVTVGQSPLNFGTGGPAQAGSINDGLMYSGVRVSFGDTPGGATFVNITESQNLPPFNAQIFYAGAGQLRARWEVVQPGDPDPTDIDLIPEEGLTLLQKAQRGSYTLIERPTGYLPPMGSYFLKGPDPRRLPKLRLGSYRILLRLEATGSGRTTPFYIPLLTYRVQSDPVRPVETASTRQETTQQESMTESEGTLGNEDTPTRVRKRFTANTDVADFSKLGELDVGRMLQEGGGLKIGAFDKKAPLVGFESINTKAPPAGQQLSAAAGVKLEWDDAKSASVDFWHLEVRNEANQLLAVARVAKRTDYQLARPLVAGLPKGSSLRWRVQGMDKEGHVTATSSWLFFSLAN